MSSVEELELQYSPSRWSKRYSADEVIQKHVEFSIEASNAAKKNIPCQLNVPYGPADGEKWDIFGTELPDDAPIFIYIHGGYWQELSRDLSSYVVKPLHKNGFKVIIVGYTLCPKVTLAQIVDQIQNAFLKSIEYAQSKGSRSLYISGHSAGVHLTASLFEAFFSLLPAKDQDLLKGVFLISGVYDLIPLIKTYVNDALHLNDVSAKKLSPLYQHLDAPESLRFCVIVGENDSPAFNEQSQLFHEKLKKLGKKSELIIVENVDHFDIVEKLNDENYEIVKLIISSQC